MRRSSFFPTLFVFAALLPFLFLSIYLYNNWPALSLSCEKGADHELMGISVELAKSGQALTGPYSRFGFRHPGPLMPYLYAAFERALPAQSTPMGEHLVAQAIMNASLMVIVGWWCVRFLRPRWMALVSFPLSYLVIWGPGGPFFHDYWNPSVTMAPMLVAVLSAAALSVGALGWIVPFTLSAAILCSSHLSSLPLVACLSLVAFILTLRRGVTISHLRKHRWAFVVALAIGLLTALPVAVEALTQPNFGNLGAIAQFQSGLDSTKSLASSARFVGTYFTRGLFAALPPSLALAAALGSVLVIAWFSSGALRTLALLCVAVTAAAVLSATRISGNFEPYLLRSMLGVVAAVQLSITASIIHLLRSRLHILRPGLVLAVSLGALWLQLPRTFTPRQQSCGQIAEPFIQALAPERGDAYRLAIEDQEAWPFSAPLALSLLRGGSQVCVDDKWRYLFDSALTCSWPSNQGKTYRTLHLYRNLPSEPPVASRSFKGPLNWMLW
jgi:hypothetical protein